MNLISQKLIEAVRGVFKSNERGLHVPIFEGNEKKYLMECIDTTLVSSVGPFVQKFEKLLESFTGAKHAICVVNGTSALHLSLVISGVESNQEVLIPALTFVATANAVSYCGAVPNFVDSCMDTLGMCPEKLEEYLRKSTRLKNNQCINIDTNRIIKAVVPMHTYGHPVEIQKIVEIAERYKLTVIEDAAESLGSFKNEKHTGTFGEIGILSFNGNKIITTGGGGAILTNNSILAQKAMHLSTTAKVKHNWEFNHDEIGFNYRLPNINAAIGCAQMEEIWTKLEYKRNIFRHYKTLFSNISEFKLIEEPLHSRSNYWLQTVLLSEDKAYLRDQILNELNSAGIAARPTWNLVSTLLPYTKTPRMELKNSENLAKRIINLPSN